MNYKKFRESIFKQKFPLNQELIKMVDGFKSHFFLKNPASQSIYVYQIEYIMEFSNIWFNGNKDIKILDWGAGKGHISHLLKEKNIDVISCDIDNDAHDSTFGQDTPILKKGNIEVVPLKHPFILPFKTESFDVVVSFGVLEHVPNDAESLKEINRVLKPNGLFFCFYLPYTYSWTQKVDRMRGGTYHDRLYNSKIVKQLLSNAKFDLIDIWHRALLPKNTIKYPQYQLIERIDNMLCKYTALKHFATNIEFVAKKMEI